MKKDTDGHIPSTAEDWECDWQGSRRHQLRRFRALPLAEKIRAVEQMEEVAARLKGKARRPGAGHE